MPGGETLVELRQSLMQAELECEGGGSLRVSPFTDVRDAGGLLQRAGFALPVVDVDRITVSYADPLRLMRELGRMGEGNALLQRRPGRCAARTLVRACELYREQFGDVDGRVPATFDILFMAAWKPHASQPKPLPPRLGQAASGRCVARAGNDRRPVTRGRAQRRLLGSPMLSAGGRAVEVAARRATAAQLARSWRARASVARGPASR